MRRLDNRPTAVLTSLGALGVLALTLVGCSTDDPEPEPEPEAISQSAGGTAGVDTADAQASTAVASDIGPPVVDGTPATGITVTGAGVASGAPDVVRVTVGVEVQRETVQEALDEANAATEDVIGTLDDAGIAPEDRQTRNFGIHPVMDYPEEGEPSITAYRVSNLIEVTVRDVDRIGEVMQQVAEAAGDNARIHGVTFDLEEDTELVAAAREAAMADARDKAEHYAELAGGELGTLIGIQDHSISSPRTAQSMDAEAAAAEMAVPIEPGQQEVNVQVVTRWSLD